MKKVTIWLMLACVSIMAVGCQSKDSTGTSTSAVNGAANGPPPSFTLCFSEYPSWVVFGVAAEKGLIDGAKGKLGPIEKKWNVDIVLKEADYDTCITMYGSNTVDAACLTNLDTLAPSTKRTSVAILPTSTSAGADACIVVEGIKNLRELKGQTTYGLEKSVSQYAFERNLELAGENPAEYKFANMDPAAAAQAVQTKQPKIKSIMVWNPFVLQTLRTRKDSKVLFDSTTIPEEIIDCVMVGQDSLKREGGENFACALIETYYTVCQQMADPATSDQTLLSLGAKFSSLGLEDMKLVVAQTRFYSNAKQGIGLFSNDRYQKKIMPAVVTFCETHGITQKDSNASVGFDSDSGTLIFSTKYMKQVNDRK